MSKTKVKVEIAWERMSSEQQPDGTWRTVLRRVSNDAKVSGDGPDQISSEKAASKASTTYDRLPAAPWQCVRFACRKQIPGRSATSSPGQTLGPKATDPFCSTECHALWSDENKA